MALITTLPAVELEMLKCRAYGHKWEDRGWLGYVFTDGTRGFEQELKCERCDTVRRDMRARGTLALLSRTYSYKDEYPGAVKQATALADVIAHDTKRKRERPVA